MATVPCRASTVKLGILQDGAVVVAFGVIDTRELLANGRFRWRKALCQGEFSDRFFEMLVPREGFPETAMGLPEPRLKRYRFVQQPDRICQVTAVARHQRHLVIHIRVARMARKRLLESVQRSFVLSVRIVAEAKHAIG